MSMMKSLPGYAPPIATNFCPSGVSMPDVIPVASNWIERADPDTWSPFKLTKVTGAEGFDERKIALLPAGVTSAL
jgi:hypothetical protein